jgi:hypothetical protein
MGQPRQDTFVDTLLPNSCEAWGQTLQFRQRTQADDSGLSGPWGRCHRKLRARPTMCGIICFCIQHVG